MSNRNRADTLLNTKYATVIQHLWDHRVHYAEHPFTSKELSDKTGIIVQSMGGILNLLQTTKLIVEVDRVKRQAFYMLNRTAKDGWTVHREAVNAKAAQGKRDKKKKSRQGGTTPKPTKPVPQEITVLRQHYVRLPSGIPVSEIDAGGYMMILTDEQLIDLHTALGDQLPK